MLDLVAVSQAKQGQQVALGEKILQRISSDAAMPRGLWMHCLIHGIANITRLLDEKRHERKAAKTIRRPHGRRWPPSTCSTPVLVRQRAVRRSCAHCIGSRCIGHRSLVHLHREYHRDHWGNRGEQAFGRVRQKLQLRRGLAVLCEFNCVEPAALWCKASAYSVDFCSPEPLADAALQLEQRRQTPCKRMHTSHGFRCALAKPSFFIFYFNLFFSSLLTVCHKESCTSPCGFSSPVLLRCDPIFMSIVCCPLPSPLYLACRRRSVHRRDFFYLFHQCRKLACALRCATV